MPCLTKNSERKPEVRVETKPETEIHPPDGGWGWVVCFAVFMTNFTITGLDSARGILFLGLLELFNESVTKTSLVGSISSGLSMFGGPFVLLLISYKASYRQIMMVGGITAAASTVASAFASKIEIMIFTYGILTGLLLAMTFFSANVLLVCYFDKKRSLASGIANSGTGCGIFMLSYLMQKSLSYYGTRGTFILLGGLFLNLTVYGSLCRPLKKVTKSTPHISERRRTSENDELRMAFLDFTQEQENASDKTSSISNGIIKPAQIEEIAVDTEHTQICATKCCTFNCDTSIVKNKTFGLLLAIYTLWAVGYSLLIYLPLYAESIGLSGEEGAIILTIHGITVTVSPILYGLLADVVHIPISYLLSLSTFSLAFSILSFPFCKTFTDLACSTVVFATSFGFGVSVRIVLIAAALGLEKVSAGYSLVTILLGIGYMVYPIINGIIYDATLSFPIIFYVNSAIAFLGSILSCGVIWEQRKGTFVK